MTNPQSVNISERQMEVLRELETAVRNSMGRRVSTMDCGGMDGSHHSSTLAQLCMKGLATRRKNVFFGDCNCKCGAESMFGHKCKGSFSYGITKEGVRLASRREIDPNDSDDYLAERP